LTTLEEVQRIDVTIDGVDEFDPELRLIKGGGGLLHEKIVASASRQVIMIADSSKQVCVLGKVPLPVDVIRFAEALVSEKISVLGATVRLRKDGAGKRFITDERNHIWDCHFGQIPDPPALARTLSKIPGVVEHGLFINLADLVLLGKGSEVLEWRRKSGTEQ
jgi:ribose 5-phosphate isomerase A